MQVISVILIIMVLLLLVFFWINILAYWKAEYNFIWFSLFLLQYFWFYIKKLK